MLWTPRASLANFRAYDSAEKLGARPGARICIGAPFPTVFLLAAVASAKAYRFVHGLLAPCGPGSSGPGPPMRNQRGPRNGKISGAGIQVSRVSTLAGRKCMRMILCWQLDPSGRPSGRSEAGLADRLGAPGRAL